MEDYIYTHTLYIQGDWKVTPDFDFKSLGV